MFLKGFFQNYQKTDKKNRFRTFLDHQIIKILKPFIADYLLLVFPNKSRSASFRNAKQSKFTKREITENIIYYWCKICDADLKGTEKIVV